METLKEEIHYCTTCGAVNKKSAVFCEECKNKIIVRHRPIVDFLKKRAKGKAAGEVTERLFKLIRDFLFDHLYGMVLTVSVVATVTTTVITATPYVKKVDALPSGRVAEIIEEVSEETYVTPEYADWCEKHAIVIMSNYMDYSDHAIWAYEGYTLNPDNISLDEIYAERAIPGFNHQGAHEMMTERIPLGIYHKGSFHRPLGMTEIKECVKGSYKFGADVTSPLGQTLHSEGYEIMECNYAISLYEGNDREGNRGTMPVEKEEFRILFVRHGTNNWYIAEETLIGRIKGDTYDMYMQYGTDAYEILNS